MGKETTLALTLLLSGCLCCGPTIPGGGLSETLSGGAYKCSYTQDAMRSDYWVKDDRYYAEITSAGHKTYVLSDGTWAYTWGEAGGKGVKFRLDNAQKQSSKPPGYVDVGNLMNNARIKCEPQAFSDSKFTPPSDIEFQDMQEMMDQQTQDNKPSTTLKNTNSNNPFSGMDCSTCDFVGDPAAKRDCQKHCTTN